MAYTLHLITAYLIMLALMSYNGYIFFSFISGNVLGFILFKLNNTFEKPKQE
jgi:hypothetical protein